VLENHKEVRVECGKKKNIKDSKQGYFKNTMAKQPSKIRIEHPKI